MSIAPESYFESIAPLGAGYISLLTELTNCLVLEGYKHSAPMSALLLRFSHL
jgi:hypothetical protein